MGLIHLDAGVVIGLLDTSDAHHRSATDLLRRVTHTGHQIAMAASAYAECLVGPSRHGSSATDVVENLFRRVPISIIDLTPRIARTAAALRADHRSLRLPDALVIATAIDQSANELITTDSRWTSAKSLKTLVTIVCLATSDVVTFDPAGQDET